MELLTWFVGCGRAWAHLLTGFLAFALGPLLLASDVTILFFCCRLLLALVAELVRETKHVDGLILLCKFVLFALPAGALITIFPRIFVRLCKLEGARCNLLFGAWRSSPKWLLPVLAILLLAAVLAYNIPPCQQVLPQEALNRGELPDEVPEETQAMHIVTTIWEWGSLLGFYSFSFWTLGGLMIILGGRLKPSCLKVIFLIPWALSLFYLQYSVSNIVFWVCLYWTLSSFWKKRDWATLLLCTLLLCLFLQLIQIKRDPPQDGQRRWWNKVRYIICFPSSDADPSQMNKDRDVTYEERNVSCALRWANGWLDVVDLAKLCSATYYYGKGDADYMLRSPGRDFSVRSPKEWNCSDSDYGVKLPHGRVLVCSNTELGSTVIAVRGTYELADWLVDLETWFESGILQLVPTSLLLFHPSVAPHLSRVIETVQWQHLTPVFDHYLQTIEDTLLLHQKDHGTFEGETIVVGHSLGGALASIYVAQQRAKGSASHSVVAFSSPGLNSLLARSNLPMDLDGLFIVPTKDLVPTVDTTHSLMQYIPCPRDRISCHSIEATVQNLSLLCHTIPDEKAQICTDVLKPY